MRNSAICDYIDKNKALPKGCVRVCLHLVRHERYLWIVSFFLPCLNPMSGRTSRAQRLAPLLSTSWSQTYGGFFTTIVLLSYSGSLSHRRYCSLLVCLLAFFRRLSTLLLRIKNSRDQSETIWKRKKHKDDPSLTRRTRRGMKTGGGETDDFFTGAPKSSSRKLSKSQKTLTYLLTYLQ